VNPRCTLQRLPAPHCATVTKIVATLIDTHVGDVYEATSRAIWRAAGIENPYLDAGFCELELVTARFREMIGRRLEEIIESRHWYSGERDGDAASLTHVWLLFARVLPMHLHITGENLIVSIDDPDTDADLEEYGELRVGPARAPDLLAGFTGRMLTGVTVFRGHNNKPHCGGLRLDFDGPEPALVIGALADEWVLAVGAVPAHVAAYWSVGD